MFCCGSNCRFAEPRGDLLECVGRLNAAIRQLSTKLILLLGCAALASTALAAWAVLRKPAESPLVSMIVSVAPVAIGSRAGCAVDGNGEVSLPGSDGRSWVYRGGRWCEYSAGKLVGLWREVPRIRATRLLYVRDGRVEIRRVPPDLTTAHPASR